MTSRGRRRAGARALFRVAALGGLGLGCSDRPAAVSSAGARDSAPRPADSLVATAPGGTEVWFTLARTDTAGGRSCVARSIEIRRGGSLVPVPLLYTLSRPELRDDTTLRARLSDGCQDGDPYLVDLRTGHPVRERR